MTGRLTVAGLAALYALFPLYGTFSAFVPHPPITPLVPRAVAIAIAGVLLLANIAVIGGAIRRRTRPPMTVPLFANVAATYLAAALGFDPPVGLGLATAIGGFCAAHVVLLACYRERGAARTVYLALLISGLSASLLAILFVVLKTPADLYAYNHGRAVATFLNPNELAEYLLAYLGASAGLAIVRRGTALGTFAAVCTGVAALALALTFSRWGIVAAAAGVLAYVVARRPRRGRWAAAAVLALAAALNLVLWTRHHDPQDTGARDVAWRAGMTTWLHFPLTGVGPLAFERLYPVMRAPDAPGADTPVAFDPHDLPLSILAESGSLGLAAFAWAYVAFGRNLRRALAGADEERRTLALALTAGVVAVSVHMLLNSVSIAFGLLVQFTALALAAAHWGFDARTA